GNVNLRNPLTSESRAAWSGKMTEFSEVVIHLDASVYAGKSFRARWRLGANNQFGSPGWTIDDVALRGAGSFMVRQRNFTDWQETVFSPAELANPSLSGPEADPDGDGVRNLLEYALGGHPLQENDRD